MSPRPPLLSHRRVLQSKAKAGNGGGERTITWDWEVGVGLQRGADEPPPSRAPAPLRPLLPILPRRWTSQLSHGEPG